MPPSWSNIIPVRVSGVRNCGSKVRGTEKLLLCDICTHVRGNPIEIKGSKGELKTSNRRSDKVASKTTETDIKHSWCMICSQKTGPGINHPCTSESKRRNICNLIEMQDEKVKQRIVGNTLRNMVDTLDRRRNEITCLVKIIRS